MEAVAITHIANILHFMNEYQKSFDVFKPKDGLLFYNYIIMVIWFYLTVGSIMYMVLGLDEYCDDILIVTAHKLNHLHAGISKILNM